VGPFVGKWTLPPTETPIDGQGWSQGRGSNLGRPHASLERGTTTRNGATLPAATLEASAPSRRPHATDEQLARAAGRGDSAAFAVLYERFQPQLLSFSRHMLGRAHDAEDVVQHTFLAADRAFRAGDVPKAVRAWLYAVARNRCVSLLRARREDQGLPEAGVPSTENLAAEVEQRDDLRNLLADLRRLPEQQRAALLLAELGDLSHPEVARVIGVRPGKVKALVFQARETLMAAAHARSIPCRSIQEELAAATGAAARRRHLRHHLDQCPTCREFAERVRAQRASLALILPVVPTVGLREGVFSGLACGTAGAGAGAGAGLGGLLAAKTTAAKLLTIAAVGGAAAGGGTVALTADDARDRARPAQRAPSAPEPAVAPASGDVPRAPAAAAEEPRPPASARGRGNAEAGPATGRSRSRDKARRAAAEPPGRARSERADDKTPPGQSKQERRGSPPGRAKQRQHDQSPGQAKERGAPPSQSGKSPAAATKAATPESTTGNSTAPKAVERKPSQPAAVAPGPAAPQPPGPAVKGAKSKADEAPAATLNADG
jgi:RNA polymerase sigma factor (sigma-70 family)